MTALQSPTAGTGDSLTSAPDAAGFDLYRLDCAVDALRDATLSQSDRAALARISLNIIDLMETYDGHAH